MFRLALCILLVVVASLAPTSHALAVLPSTCTPPTVPPADVRNDTLDTCAEVTILTPAGASHVKANATLGQVGSQYNASLGTDVLLVLGGNPGPFNSSQNQTLSVPLRV